MVSCAVERGELSDGPGVPDPDAHFLIIYGYILAERERGIKREYATWEIDALLKTIKTARGDDPRVTVTGFVLDLLRIIERDRAIRGLSTTGLP